MHTPTKEEQCPGYIFSMPKFLFFSPIAMWWNFFNQELYILSFNILHTKQTKLVSELPERKLLCLPLLLFYFCIISFICWHILMTQIFCLTSPIQLFSTVVLEDFWHDFLNLVFKILFSTLHLFWQFLQKFYNTGNKRLKCILLCIISLISKYPFNFEIKLNSFPGSWTARSLN